jgi:hypothetical protein
MPLPARAAPNRRPSDASFIARRLARIAWDGAPSPRHLLVEICRAELEWAVAEWRWFSGDPDPDGPRDRWGPHPAEQWRLPHEWAAARVVSCHLHVDVALSRWTDLKIRLRRQRAAARDEDRSCDQRLYWADAATGTRGDIRFYLARRRLAWRCFLLAAADYHRRKALIDNEEIPAAA